MINKITNSNYEILKKAIIEKINADHIIPYIIQKLTESSIIHHIYIPLYVGILREIPSSKKEAILYKLCNKYHIEYFFENKVIKTNVHAGHLLNEGGVGQLLWKKK